MWETNKRKLEILSISPISFCTYISLAKFGSTLNRFLDFMAKKDLLDCCVECLPISPFLIRQWIEVEGLVSFAERLPDLTKSYPIKRLDHRNFLFDKPIFSIPAIPEKTDFALDKSTRMQENVLSRAQAPQQYIDTKMLHWSHSWDHQEYNLL